MAKYDELCSKYWVPGWQIIRPSGNAIEYEGYKKIIVEEGVKILSTELVSINSTKVPAHPKPSLCVYGDDGTEPYTTHESLSPEPYAKYALSPLLLQPRLCQV